MTRVHVFKLSHIFSCVVECFSFIYLIYTFLVSVKSVIAVEIPIGLRYIHMVKYVYVLFSCGYHKVLESVTDYSYSTQITHHCCKALCNSYYHSVSSNNFQTEDTNGYENLQRCLNFQALKTTSPVRYFINAIIWEIFVVT